MFHKATDLTGYAVHATDGVVGQVADLFIDSEDWRVRYLVITPDGSVQKQSIVVPIERVEYMDVDGQALHLNLSCHTIHTGDQQREDEFLTAHQAENDSLNEVDEALRETFPASDPAATY